MRNHKSVSQSITKGSFRDASASKNLVGGFKIDQIRTKGSTASVGIHLIQVNSYCRNLPIRKKWIPTVAVDLNWWIPTEAVGPTVLA